MAVISIFGSVWPCLSLFGIMSHFAIQEGPCTTQCLIQHKQSKSEHCKSMHIWPFLEGIKHVQTKPDDGRSTPHVDMSTFVVHSATKCHNVFFIIVQLNMMCEAWSHDNFWQFIQYLHMWMAFSYFLAVTHCLGGGSMNI